MLNTEKKDPKKRNRPLIPNDYFEEVADKIQSNIATKEILVNTIREIWCDGFSRGYLRRLDDSKHFRESRDANFNDYWGKVKDYVDDVIHGAVQPKSPTV
jgi:hypothetical protein